MFPKSLFTDNASMYSVKTILTNSECFAISTRQPFEFAVASSIPNLAILFYKTHTMLSIDEIKHQLIQPMKLMVVNLKGEFKECPLLCLRGLF